MAVRRPALLLSLVCAVVLAAPTAAEAGPPSRIRCGDTLTTSTVLTHDLTCPGDGLRLGVGVTLDLRGHTLRGSGSGVGLLVAPHGAVVVRNGTLTGWGTAVDTEELDDEDYLPQGTTTIDKVRFRANGVGVDASGQSGTGRFVKPTTITRSTFTGHTYEAIGAGWWAVVTVDRSTFTDNQRVLFSEGDATLTRSTFVRNQLVLAATEGSVHVSGSTFVDNPVGIRLYRMAQATVDRSTFTGSDVALDGGIDENEVDVRRSTFTHNTRALAIGSGGGAAVGNTLHHNGEAIVGGNHPDYPVGHFLVQGNKLRHNGQGIVIDAWPDSVSVGGNDVRHSAGWGIHVPGAVDLGGNRASGNGNQPQCVGVVCAS